MLSKETFLSAIKNIQEQNKINENFSNALQTVGNGHFVFGTESLHYTALMAVLKEAMNDKYDYISWWLYDTSDYIVIQKDPRNKNLARTLDLSTPEALYDFLADTEN